MSNITITFEVPAELSIVRAGTHVTVDVAAIPANNIANLFAMALGNKIGDSAAGALAAVGLQKGDEPTDAERKAMAEWAQAKMQAVLDTIYAGEWSQRGGAATNDEHGAYRTFIRNIIRNSVKASATHAKAYKAAEDRNAFLDAIFDKQDETKRDSIIATAKKLAAEAKTKVDVEL